MILKPSIDSLLEKIDSKYSLVILASKRAHELEEGAKPMLTKYDSVKNVGKSLEEIDAGDVIIEPNPELKRMLIQQKEEAEKLARTKEQEELERKIKEDQL